MKTLTFEELTEAAQSSVGLMTEMFSDPDDDFAPALLVATPNGMIPCVFDGPLEDEQDKDKLAAVMQKLVLETMAVRAAFVSSAWMTVETEAGARAAKDQWDAFVREHGRNPQTYAEMGSDAPSDSPDRIEIVGINVVEPERVAFYWAQIKRRDGRPPELGEWQDMGEHESAVVTSRFVESIVAALKRVRET